jgi:hypothetical protein
VLPRQRSRLRVKLGAFLTTRPGRPSAFTISMRSGWDALQKRRRSNDLTVNPTSKLTPVRRLSPSLVLPRRRETRCRARPTLECFKHSSLLPALTDCPRVCSAVVPPSRDADLLREPRRQAWVEPKRLPKIDEEFEVITEDEELTRHFQTHLVRRPSPSLGLPRRGATRGRARRRCEPSGGSASWPGARRCNQAGDQSQSCR